MEGPKPLLTDFGIHRRFESYAFLDVVGLETAMKKIHIFYIWLALYVCQDKNRTEAHYHNSTSEED